MGEELPQVSPGQPKDMREIHKYNLRPRPTKRNIKYTPLQGIQQSTKVAIQNHTHTSY